MTSPKKQSSEAAIREIRRRTRRKFSPEEKIRIMAKIDEVIEAHGGWPGAFQTGESTYAAEDNDSRIAAESAPTYGD
jgi:hypothetical protein